MDKNIKIILSIFFAVSFFTFGWLSHTAYKPVHRIEPPSVLDKIKKEKLLNVVLLNSPSTYYIGSDGPKGFEYDLTYSFSTLSELGTTHNIAFTFKSDYDLIYKLFG